MSLESPPLTPRKRRFNGQHALATSHLPKRWKASDSLTQTLYQNVVQSAGRINKDTTTAGGFPSQRIVVEAESELGSFDEGAQLYQFTNHTTQFDSSDQVQQLSSSLVNLLPRLQPNPSASYASLEEESHANRLAVQADMTQGKGTEAAYGRHVKDYTIFWDDNQAMRAATDPSYAVIPSFPITATKVAIYLAYATTRCKRTRDGTEIQGTTLGTESIKQLISALEHYRRTHQHESIYRECSESRLPLRNDERITTYEKASRATENQLIAESKRAKASGAANDTYTDEELIRGAMWFMRNGNTKSQIHTGIRDRVMLLISTTTAYRGDNTRRIAWSDLRMRDVPLLDIGPDVAVKALVFLSNQGKTNTIGRIDEQAALRHRLPELSPPDFTPVFNLDDPQDIGVRPWYDIRLFPGNDGETSEMSYENHRKRVNNMKLKNNIEINKVTHAGRPYAAATAREHRASRDDTKVLGGWSQPGSYHAYDWTLPIDAMMGAASFNARKQETYMISREQLVPPDDMTDLIFPWVESEELARQE
ncbi:hypothetical protein AB1N83_013839 [Pleurotus pulmonarius]